MTYKIFCDESNHLEYKENKTLSSNVMVLGAICINENESINFSKHLKFLKHKYNYKNEIKWTKLFSSKHDFYDELISSFFNNTALKFRAILVDNKQNLNHKIYNEGDADQFYYKAYFYVLKELLTNCEKAKIYLDYKDNKCGEKMKKLSHILEATFHKQKELSINTIRSDESHIIQLTDMFVGAIGYKARTDIEHKSYIKNHIIKSIENFTSYNLSKGTPPWEDKFNIFKFQPRTK